MFTKIFLCRTKNLLCRNDYLYLEIGYTACLQLFNPKLIWSKLQSFTVNFYSTPSRSLGGIAPAAVTKKNEEEEVTEQIKKEPK